MHGGPFANIAHGCNSIRATKLGLKLADYCITEAGFGSDLGAEKFLDIKCRLGGLKPSAVVIVATVRALRYNGGVPKSEVGQPNMEALKKGIVNLGAHIENMKKFGVNVIVAINRFESDSDEELEYIREYCRQHGAESAMSEMFAKGGDGGIELALKLVEMCEKETELKFMYSLEMSIKEKIEAVAKNIYGAGGVNYTAQAEKAIKRSKSSVRIYRYVLPKLSIRCPMIQACLDALRTSKLRSGTLGFRPEPVLRLCTRATL